MNSQTFEIKTRRIETGSIVVSLVLTERVDRNHFHSKSKLFQSCFTFSQTNSRCCQSTGELPISRCYC